MMQAALRDGKWEGPLARVRRDGRTFVASVVITKQSNSSRKHVGFLLISKDISEQLRLEEEVKTTGAYSRSLSEFLSRAFSRSLTGPSKASNWRSVRDGCPGKCPGGKAVRIREGINGRTENRDAGTGQTPQPAPEASQTPGTPVKLSIRPPSRAEEVARIEGIEEGPRIPKPAEVK